MSKRILTDNKRSTRRDGMEVEGFNFGMIRLYGNNYLGDDDLYAVIIPDDAIFEGLK